MKGRKGEEQSSGMTEITVAKFLKMRLKDVMGEGADIQNFLGKKGLEDRHRERVGLRWGAGNLICKRCRGGCREKTGVDCQRM